MAVAGGGRTRVQEVDRHVGSRMRERRRALGLTQGELAAQVGVTWQQLHKYEAGANRITVGRLHAVAETLGVGVDHFYEGLGTPVPAGPPQRGRPALAIARNFVTIADRRHREALLVLARALAGRDEVGPQGTA